MTTRKPPVSRHYSGDGSRAFWRRVNALTNEIDRRVAYVLGCSLQGMEERTLTLLESAEMDQRHARKTARKKKP